LRELGLRSLKGGGIHHLPILVSRTGIPFELHWHLGLREYFPQAWDLKAFWKKSHAVQWHGCRAMMPCVEDACLLTLLNSFFLGTPGQGNIVRALGDWEALLWKKGKPGTGWDNFAKQFSSRVRVHRLERPAWLALMVLNQILGNPRWLCQILNSLYIPQKAKEVGELLYPSFVLTMVNGDNPWIPSQIVRFAQRISFLSKILPSSHYNFIPSPHWGEGQGEGAKWVRGKFNAILWSYLFGTFVKSNSL